MISLYYNQIYPKFTSKLISPKIIYIYIFFFSSNSFDNGFQENSIFNLFVLILIIESINSYS